MRQCLTYSTQVPPPSHLSLKPRISHNAPFHVTCHSSTPHAHLTYVMAFLHSHIAFFSPPASILCINARGSVQRTARLAYSTPLVQHGVHTACLKYCKPHVQHGSCTACLTYSAPHVQHGSRTARLTYSTPPPSSLSNLQCNGDPPIYLPCPILFVLTSQRVIGHHT